MWTASEWEDLVEAWEFGSEWSNNEPSWDTRKEAVTEEDYFSEACRGPSGFHFQIFIF